MNNKGEKQYCCRQLVKKIEKLSDKYNKIQFCTFFPRHLLLRCRWNIWPAPCKHSILESEVSFLRIFRTLLCWKVHTGGKSEYMSRYVCRVQEASRLTLSNATRITAYQSEALGGGSPSLDCCQRPLLHHILRLLIHSHHWLFGDPQQPRDQFIFTLHLFLPERETSDDVYAGAQHLHRWFIRGGNAKRLCQSAGAVVMRRVEEEK